MVRTSNVIALSIVALIAAACTSPAATVGPSGYSVPLPGSDVGVAHATLARVRNVSLGICAARASTGFDLRGGLSVNDRESPLVTWVNGPLMARRPGRVGGRSSAFQWTNLPRSDQK